MFTKDKLIAAIREVPISQTYEEYVEALADRLITLKSEWISVEDRLPDYNGSYLVIGKSGTPHTAHFYKDNPYGDKHFKPHFSNRYAKYWMPLPRTEGEE